MEVEEDDVERLFYERGWSDGLPIVAPTPERVLRALAGTDLPPGHVIGGVGPAFGEATVEKIAVNAVMAGCGPEHLPVVIAAVQAMLDERFNLYGCQATTHVVAPLVIVNGPIAEELDVASGYNCFGQGHRANAVIGRAVRFVLTNIGGALPGKLDRATFGTPAKYSYCVAENEQDNPWAPLHVERGHDRSTSTVTVVGAEAPHNINDHGSESAAGLLKTIAESMCQPGSNNAYLYDEGPWVVLGPEHAAALAREGWTKEAVKAHLFEHSQIPIERWSRDNIERYLLIRWPACLSDRVRAWLKDPAQTVKVPLCTRAEHINIIVAGGAGKHSLFIPTFGATASVTVPLTLKDGRPAASIGDFAKR
ncbi:MAG: hypothetical protein IT455_06690 [Planctomycetes bacterium]|nr:hypothetical protein [Planctomycetota bacterium]